MLSTFHGLETVRRGMTAQQQALYVTGHNIANANTPGYSRQRVNFEQTPPYPFASKNRPVMPGQMGTGVEGGTVQRMREEFLDVQYRGENMKYGYWNTRAEALYKMEEIMNEPSDEGLAKTLDRFWQSLQDLAVNPSNSGARSVVRQRGMAVAETFHYLSSSLKSIRDDIKNELDVTVKAVNSLARQLNDLNKQISEVEVHGYLPNDLYDERNRLLDELSQYVNVKVTPVPSGGSALKIAEGRFTVELVDRTGSTVIGTLVDGRLGKVNEFQVTYQDNVAKTGPIVSFSLGDASFSTFERLKENGKVGALLYSYGYSEDGGTTTKGLYPEMLRDLNAMAKAFADQFNTVHSNGWSVAEIKNNATSPSTKPFFTYDLADPAGTLDIAQAIKDSLDNIAASASGQIGDGSNAQALAEVKNGMMNIAGNTTTIQNFYESLIGQMAVNAQEAKRLSENSEVLRQSVDERRMAVSSVSLDEEMMNMMKFQHAYNASARMITMIDQMLDKIINNMGIVGR
ncbi:flagellar hook-associated protein FlgK [Anoxybacillus ayderensis]|uniref:flagellar hook-associated protein FlgK n=1 Tax=Anoxybacillus ayderensis TaxID=265546 RepID=UPI002E226290|nr:flagellar hook-associated protein FlgK [Anoxybacillus ayderensis]MED0658200.1 flagellar hook-associated protein FlgK [Anoxybacillus ayderensis]